MRFTQCAQSRPLKWQRLQQHLDTCGECRRKLADILGELSLAALTVPQEPVAAEMRDRFINRLRAEAATQSPESIRPANAPGEPAKSGNWFGGLGWAAAAAALLFAAYMGNTAHNLRQQLDAQTRPVRAAFESGIAGAADSRCAYFPNSETRQADGSEGLDAAHSACDLREGTKARLFLSASELHPLKANKTYELWLIPANGQAPIPAGLFRPDVNGTASLVMPPLPTGIDAKAFGVTIEDAQGAKTPTLPIVMSGQ